MSKFNVTYNVVSQESAEYGDVEESGYISENSRLSDAVQDVIRTRTNEVDGSNIESDDCRVSVYNGMEFITGDSETRTLHRPANCTNASWNRICRAVRVAY